MNRFCFSLLLLSLTVALTVGLQNCKKSSPDPVKPTTTTPPTSSTSPPTSVTTATTTAPTVNIAAAPTVSGITTTSATVSAVLDGNGGAAISQHGFVYSKTNQTPTLTDSKAELGATTGPFPLTLISKLTGLDASTTYYVRAFATNDKGTGYGKVEQMKTTANPVADVQLPIVFISPVTNISNTTTMLNARFSRLGNKPIVSYGFVLSDTDPNLQAGSTATRVVSTTQPTGNIEFSLDVRELRANTKYFVRAYATAQVTNDQPTPKIEYAQSEVVTFTTLAEAVSGSWKELAGLKFTPFGVDFFFDGNFYKQSEQKTLSFSPATLDKQNLGSQFPGTGYVGVFKQIDKKAYALMNYNFGESTKPFNELWEYDLVAKKWTRKADFPGTARIDGITLVVNNKLYFGTGNEYTKAKPGFATTLKDWWEYDPATDKWTQKADFPLTAYNLSGFTTDTKAVAGIGLSFNSSINRESWWEYNPQTNTWRTLNKIVGDYSPSSQYVWSELYNGKNYALFPNQARTKYAMWVYNPASETWTRTAELPLNFSAFTDFSGVSVNGKPWLVTNSRQTFEFTP